MTTYDPFAPLTEQVKALASGELTATDVTEATLTRIARLDSDLNAFCEVFSDEVREQAADLDAELARTGVPRGPLHGAPIAIKDEYDVAGHRTGFGTNAVTKLAKADCAAVARLRAAGAVIVGHTNMPEFGQWPFTESTTHGYTRNPWNRDHSTAGSSGGSAAATAAGLVAAGLGGDGGGSIRLPAAWCGLVGLKCQRGRVSAAPHAALWRSLGVIGPLTRTVADTALIYDAIAGYEETDLNRAEPWEEPLTATLAKEPGSLNIRLAPDAPVRGLELDKRIEGGLERVAEILAGLGHHVERGPSVQVSPGLTMTRVMSGGVVDELADIDDVKRLEARTRAGLRLYRPVAKTAPAADRKIAELTPKAMAIFDEVDVLLTPTTPFPALPIGQLDGRGFISTALFALKVAAYTSPWNVWGNPAVSVPVGFTLEGLPLAVQLVVGPGREGLALQVAAQIEREVSITEHPAAFQ